MTGVTLPTLLLQLACGAGDLEITARMPEAMPRGEAVAFQVAFGLADNLQLESSGVPTPILQIDAPPSVELIGEPPADARALARNGFLYAPFERTLEPGEQSVAFRVTAEPRKGEQIGLNVVCYVVEGPAGKTRFLRRRLELPVQPGATAVEGDADRSTWGDGTFLQIGERARSFNLPRADGTFFDLASVLGKQPVVVMTYRAFW